MMKVYNVELNKQTKEELEHRLSYLRRNQRLVDSLGQVEISYKHRQEILIINEELLRRGA